MKKILQISAEAWVLILSFLLPLKFGIFAGLPEATAFFPEDLFSYLVINWPATAFGLLTAPALLLCLAAFPDACGRYRSQAWIFALLWSAGLLLGALPGLCGISSWDFAVLQFNHFGGIGCYALAVYLLAAGSAERRRHLLAAAPAGGIKWRFSADGLVWDRAVFLGLCPFTGVFGTTGRQWRDRGRGFAGEDG